MVLSSEQERGSWFIVIFDICIRGSENNVPLIAPKVIMLGAVDLVTYFPSVKHTNPMMVTHCQSRLHRSFGNSWSGYVYERLALSTLNPCVVLV